MSCSLPSVKCDYCQQPAELLRSSATLYRGRDYGPAWFCPCQPGGAWVGTHKNSPTFQPLGRLANAELRKAKVAAHNAFDPIWQAHALRVVRSPGGKKKSVRSSAYMWLAQQLKIDGRDCHIGMFTVEQCRQVVEICRNIKSPTDIFEKPVNA